MAVIVGLLMMCGGVGRATRGTPTPVALAPEEANSRAERQHTNIGRVLVIVDLDLSINYH
jgi:hypothetical protein